MYTTRYMDDSLQSVVDKFIESMRSPMVCEVGCGSLTQFAIPNGAIVIGLDISRRQLIRHNGVSARVVGDVQDLPFLSQWADLVVCWEVLEHVSDPACAFDELARIIRPGGALVLAVPHVWSIKGLVTKLTPHSFHVWFYRHVLGKPTAGQDDTAPFPVTRSWMIAPHKVRQLATAHGLELVFERLYEAQKQVKFRERLKITGMRWRIVCSAVRVLSFGHVAADSTDWIVVLSRPSITCDISPIALGGVKQWSIQSSIPSTN